jgi:DNA-binding GntR family transcriptional regulator
MLGLSRQTVNASLNDLEKTGAIRRHRGAIEIVDPETLHVCYEKFSSGSKSTRS